MGTLATCHAVATMAKAEGRGTEGNLYNSKKASCVLGRNTASAFLGLLVCSQNGYMTGMVVPFFNNTLESIKEG